jgi:hypothetical protein
MAPGGESLSTRRRFLARLAGGAAVAALDASLVGGASRAHAQAALRSETLRDPIVLGRGGVVADRRLVLAPDFRWTNAKAVIYASAPDVAIRNVEIVGASAWLPRWNAEVEPQGAPPGICSGMCGIRLQNAPRARIEGVSVRGFPGAAIDGFGLADAVIRDVRATDCFFGVIARHYAPNPGLRIERVHVRDLWGPGAGRWRGIGGPPSRLRAGRFIGSDGIVCHSLRRGVLRDSSVLGEQFGSFKLVNPQDTEVSGLRGIHLMVQGTSDLEWKIDREPSRRTVVHDCVFDKGLGSGEVAEQGNAIQVSWHVEDLRIERCTLVAAGRNGHGIQFAVDAHGRVVDCTFDGFNGTRGTAPAHAVEVADRSSSVNADLAEVNSFRNQRRILLEHGRGGAALGGAPRER